MPLSRPVLIALVGAILAVAAFLSTRGAGESTVEPTKVQPTGDKTKQAPAKPKDPLATPAARPVKSAAVVARLSGTGKPSETESYLLTGKFERVGPGVIPKFEMDVRYRNTKGSRHAGAVSLGDSGFVTVRNKAYTLPPQAWAALTAYRAKLREFAKDDNSGADLLGLTPTKWQTAATRKAGPKLDGTETVLLAGRVDVRKASADFRRTGGGFDRGELAELKAAKTAKLDIYVGKSDGIVRRYDMRIAAKDDGVPSTLKLRVDLTDVNKPQKIAAPTRPVPVSKLGARDRDYATDMLAAGAIALDLPGAGTALKAGYKVDGSGKTAVTPKEQAVLDKSGLPKGIANALARKRVIVLFFRQSGSADDAAVAGAVNAQRGLKGVSVFTDNIRRLARYRAVVGALGISQAPAVVIVGRDGQARVVEGFVDGGSLRQQVVDTR